MTQEFLKYYFESISTRLAVAYLLVVFLVAVFANVLAHPQSGLLSKYGSNSIGSENNIFKEPGFKDRLDGNVYVHPLGTDGRGRDVAANLIHGARTSLMLGFLSSLIAIILGTFLGVVSAYYGNKSLKINSLFLGVLIIAIPFVAFYSFEFAWNIRAGDLRFNGWKFAMMVTVSIGLLYLISKILAMHWKPAINFPMDDVIMRFAEIFRAVPTLFLLLSIISFFKSQSLWSTALIIGMLGWSRILRLVRGEILNLKKEQFISNARLIGLGDFQIVLRHMMPNILPILLVSMAFLISANILLESTLAFLGLGLPIDQASWGGLLSQSREDFGAWWLAIFPGLAITFTLFSLNILAERYNNLIK